MKDAVEDHAGACSQAKKRPHPEPWRLGPFRVRGGMCIGPGHGASFSVVETPF